MFCPKCGLQNADHIKFCRGCGVSLSDVLAFVEGRLPELPAEPNNQNELFSTGIRNLILGIGFLIISLLIYKIPGETNFWLLFLFPAFSLIASGVSRIVKANGMKRAKIAGAAEPVMLPPPLPNQALPSNQTEYVDPSKSIYEKDNLAERPLSVTETTTRRLQKNFENDEITVERENNRH